MSRTVVMTCGARTPIGDLGGTLAAASAVTLGRAAATAAMARAGLTPDRVGEVVFGNVLQAGQGQNPARQLAVGAGIPKEVPSWTVNMVCGSGMKAVGLGMQSILLNQADIVLAGGMESMSQSPHLLPALRTGARLGHAQVLDSVLADGLTDVFGRYPMGMTAERLAALYGISRDEQDRYALQSHQRCGEAAGRRKEETVPVALEGRKGERLVSEDEHPRPDATLEKLAALRPVFDPAGSVTAGNASGINDGAAALLLIEGSHPLARGMDTLLVRDVVCVGCEPELMGLGPVHAVRALLRRQRLTPADIGLWELNEAFAAQALAVLRDLALDPARVNVNGGAIALGHPIGASGARILVTLAHQMRRQGTALGVATLCIGGGMGIAMLLENR